MKKILYSIASFGVFIPLLQSCNQSGSAKLTASDSAAIATAYQEKHAGDNLKAIPDTATAIMDQSLETIRYKAQGTGNFLITREMADRYRDVFERNIRNPQSRGIDPKISQAVWFDSAALNLLMGYINDRKNKLDGARIYFMAYEQGQSAEGQENPNQMSVVVVPTHRGRTEGTTLHHTSDWDILQPKADAFKKLLKSRDDGLNHGQLCPTLCD